MASHSLDPKQNPKDEKPFVAALFVTICRASSFSFFGRNARWNLNLGSRFANRKKRETKSRNESNWISSTTFRNFFAIAKFEKSINKTRNKWPLTITRLSFILDISNYISWNRLSRENAPTRPETDNLPGPTYL